MKKISSISFAIAAILFLGCNRPDIVEPAHPSQMAYHVWGDTPSRVHLDGTRLYWNAGDELSLFWSQANVKYIFCGEDDATDGPIEAASGNVTEGELLEHTYALYPYDASATITSNGVITTSLPQSQHYQAGSMASEANLMVAVTEDAESSDLFLRNAFGYLRLQLYGDDITVKNISISGNNNEAIAGRCFITAKYDVAPKVTMDNSGSQTITLNCGEGVALSSSQEEPTEFIIVLPPMTLTKGITVRTANADGAGFEMTTYNSVQIIRNTIQTMATVKVIPGNIEGLTAPANVQLQSSAVVSQSVQIGSTEEDLTIETTDEWMGIIGGTATTTAGSLEEIRLWAEPNFSATTRRGALTVTGATSGKSMTINVVQEPYFNSIDESLPARFEAQTSSCNTTNWISKGVCSPNNSSAVVCAVSTTGKAFTYSIGSTGVYLTGMSEGDYLLYAVPTKRVGAGEQIDFMCTLGSTSKGEPKHYVFEYWDNDRWNCPEESLLTAENGLKYHIYCNDSYDQNYTFTQSFTIQQQIINGSIKVRLRDLESGNGTPRIPSGKGYMGMYLINYPNARPVTDTKKALFIGNSYTYYFGTPFMFKEIARSEGHQVETAIGIKGSQEFSEHLTNNQFSLEAINRGGHDYAFLQDSSPNAAYYADANYDAAKRAKILKACKDINNLTLQHSSGCQIVYERTWACPYDNYRGYNSYDKLDCLLKKGQEMLVKAVEEEVTISPVGLGFQVAREEGINLLHTDNRHQSREGAYIKACINYLFVYNERFTNSVSNCGVDPAIAKKIREIAERVVFDGVAETANSYIVKTGQTFSFLADIKGNGYIPSISSITSNALNGTKVKVLWSTYNTTTAPASNDALISSLTLMNGIITLTAGSQSGNAVIALCDNNDKILWSWHIWICDDIQNQTYNGQTWMDRNLGALSATAGNPLSLGLLYQFGRKDPFYGSAAINTLTAIKTTGTWPTATSEIPVSPEEFSINNPMQLIKAKNAPSDWYTSVESGQNNTLWNTNNKKTMYDPCPKGYKVPGRYAWLKGQTSSGEAFFTEDNFAYDEETHCRIYNEGGLTVVYPIAGCISREGALKNTGTTGYYRSSDPTLLSGKTHLSDIFEINATEIDSKGGNYRASSYSIRCVKE